MRIQIGGRTYTPEDLREGRHLDDPNIDTDTDTAAHNVTNIATGEGSIQAGSIRGGIHMTFDD